MGIEEHRPDLRAPPLALEQPAKTGPRPKLPGFRLLPGSGVDRPAEASLGLLGSVSGPSEQKLTLETIHLRRPQMLSTRLARAQGFRDGAQSLVRPALFQILGRQQGQEIRREYFGPSGPKLRKTSAKLRDARVCLSLLGSGPTIEDHSRGQPLRKSMLSTEGNRRLGSIPGHLNLTPELVQHAGPHKGQGAAERVRQLLSEGESRIAVFQSPRGIAKSPERDAGEQTTTDTGIMTAVEERMRSMLLPVVESHSRLDVLSRRRRLANPTQSRPERMMGLEQEGLIVGALREHQELLPELTTTLGLPLHGPEEPQPPQRLKHLAGIPDLLAELPRARVCQLDLGRSESLCRLQGRSESKLQSQFLAGLFGGLGQHLDQVQALREMAERFRIRRPHKCFASGLTKIADRLAPHFPPNRMVSQRLKLFIQPVRIEPFDSIDDPGVERAATVMQKPRVCHLVRQGVLEGVLGIREEPRLVQELGGLQAGKAAAQVIFL